MTAISRSFTSTRKPSSTPDTPAITPVKLGQMVVRTHWKVVDTDSRLGRISEFSHCSREAAEEV